MHLNFALPNPQVVDLPEGEEVLFLAENQLYGQPTALDNVEYFLVSGAKGCCKPPEGEPQQEFSDKATVTAFNQNGKPLWTVPVIHGITHDCQRGQVKFRPPVRLSADHVIGWGIDEKTQVVGGVSGVSFKKIFAAA